MTFSDTLLPYVSHIHGHMKILLCKKSILIFDWNGGTGLTGYRNLYNTVLAPTEYCTPTEYDMFR